MESLKNKKYIFLKHTADIKFQAFGKTPEKCFENASYALKEILISEKEKIKPAKTKKISCEGKDFGSLLYNFLEEFLFLLDSKNFLFSRVSEIKIKNLKQGYKLIAKILGDNSKNYKLKAHIKAITYNDMFVKFDDNLTKYSCQVVVDI